MCRRRAHDDASAKACGSEKGSDTQRQRWGTIVRDTRDQVRDGQRRTKYRSLLNASDSRERTNPSGDRRCGHGERETDAQCRDDHGGFGVAVVPQRLIPGVECFDERYDDADGDDRRAEVSPEPHVTSVSDSRSEPRAAPTSFLSYSCRIASSGSTLSARRAGT